MSEEKNQTMQKSLPSSYYHEPEIFAREKEAIFFREWFCAGREEQLPLPGDYVVVDVCGESILVVRTKDGEVRAHYNVCRHRGAQLVVGCEDKEEMYMRGGVLGTSGIRCPYHQWTYALDGTLQNAPYLREGDGFCKEELSLYPVDVELWGGFFFLRLVHGAEPGGGADRSLRGQFGDAMERVKRYPLQDLRTAKRVRYEVEANWKIVLENYNECYHCGGVHPELCEVVPAFRQQGGANLEWERGIAHKEGAVTFTWTGQTKRAPFPGLDDDEKVRHKGELIYPNLMLSLACDHAAAFTLWPRGPERTTVVCDFLFHPSEMKNPEFDPADAVEFWDLVNRQDWAICKRVQQGTRSRVHEFGYYGPMEDLSLDIRKYVSERLERRDPQG